MTWTNGLTCAATVAGLALAAPALAGNSEIRVTANVAGQGNVDIGTIEVDDNDGMGGGITGTFTFAGGFGFLDEWYNFRWINVETGYTLNGVPQLMDPLLGALPAIDPAPGPVAGGEDFNDPAPFYFTNPEHDACMAEGFGAICVPGVSSTFSDNRFDGAGTNSQITFETYLVVQSVTDDNLPAMTFCVLAGFEWTYDNTTGAQTQTQSITNPSAAGISTALGNANAPGFAGWSATTSCTLEECPSVLDCISSDVPGTFFSPSVWTRDGEEIGRTFEDGAFPLPGETLYDFTYLPTEPNDWHWGIVTADGLSVMVWVENIPPDTGVTVEIVASPKIPQVMLVVDVGNDQYALVPFGGGASDCCQPHDTPGCDQLDCQQQVCEIDPLCCELAWGPFCAQLAMEVCGPLCQGGPLFDGVWSQYPGDIPPSLGFGPTGALRVLSFESLPCPADTDGNGAVDVDDLVNVILDWNTDGSGHNGDVNGDGIVNVDDLVEVILSWGPC